MKWLIRTVILQSKSFRQRELSNFISEFEGTLIDSDENRTLFDKEIDDKVKELNEHDSSIPAIIINRVINADVKGLPGVYEFSEKDNSDICMIFLNPVLKTYCPKGGAQ